MSHHHTQVPHTTTNHVTSSYTCTYTHTTNNFFSTAHNHQLCHIIIHKYRTQPPTMSHHHTHARTRTQLTTSLVPHTTTTFYSTCWIRPRGPSGWTSGSTLCNSLSRVTSPSGSSSSPMVCMVCIVCPVSRPPVDPPPPHRSCLSVLIVHTCTYM